MRAWPRTSDTVIGAYPLHSVNEEVPEAGWFGRLADDMKLWIE
jgi:hypothetical protein